MPVLSASSAISAAATLAAAGAVAVPFERAFQTGAAPATSHAVIVYRAGGGLHRLELWRDGDRRLRRDTDGRLISLAVHRPSEAGYRLDLYDRARQIHTVIDRDSLYRVGRFTDWTDLAHGLRRPPGGYQLRAATAPPGARSPLVPCRWFMLTQGAMRSTICWSATEALPLDIVDGTGRSIWRVTALDHRPIPSKIFQIDSHGYVLNDATQDISGD